MPNKVKQELVDIEVTEVSLVDHPANEEPFVVLKSLSKEELDMAEKKAATVVKTVGEKPVDDVNPESSGDVESVPVEVPANSNEAVTKAMEQVTTLVESIVAKAEPQTKEGGDEDAPEAPPAADQKDGVQKGGTPIVAAPEATPPEATPPEATPPQSNPDAITGLVMDGIIEAVTKAKTLTPERVEVFKEAVAALQGVVDASGKPKPLVKSESAKPVPSDIQNVFKAMKDGLAEVAKALMDQVSVINDSVQALSGRVEMIEKAKMPSKSVDADGGTDTKMKKGGLWTNVL